MTTELLSTKSYTNFPCAHRQWRHTGNCALVHGYSRSFHFQFAAKERDACGFVVDFGALKWLKGYLDQKFDHTLLLCYDDPLMCLFRELEAKGGAHIVVLPYGVGMEDTAMAVGEWADEQLRHQTKGRCWVTQLEVRENDKNSGIWINPKAGFRGWHE